MTDRLLARLPDALARWRDADPVMHDLAAAHPPTPRRPITASSPFEALVASIIHQQVSLAAGAAIQARVTAAAGGRVTPGSVAAAGRDALTAAGLSRRKTAYVLDLAAKASDGVVDFDALARAADADVIRALTSVKGIGAWTAKMFLLFHLDRPDVLAHEDLGLQIAVARAYDVPRAQAAARMQALAPAWSPFASLAALTLWNWRRVA